MPEDIARSVRDLVRRLDRAALACRLADGCPYASLVLVVVDHDLSPLLLLSDLAEHTKAIAGDPRVSLLFDGTQGLDQPLTGARVSLVGRAEPTTDSRLKQRFLAHHPDASMYAGFRDFRFYRVSVARAHLVAGFGKIHWVDADHLMPRAPSPALVEAEAGIVAHMNEDHAEALDLYADKLLGLAGRGWRMTGIDHEGFDLRLGGQVARLSLPEPIEDAEGARKGLVGLLAKARSA